MKEANLRKDSARKTTITINQTITIIPTTKTNSIKNPKLNQTTKKKAKQNTEAVFCRFSTDMAFCAQKTANAEIKTSTYPVE